ncbi:acyl-CoA dehydrogenase family protein [Pyruvatibacter mobilis]|jgi:alkylation response protein AidB-like acyl-CoA dehydrogenase|uniref:Pimeloyl-CoA dehydrogenase large subunit n=1 Tax=Pyruvatibacter mobilis TaxID=1712261 RepID=A0A845QAH7_9HYPH|nr:acyl-CoA dehydrogenase family protein [Pyruvatibacter mobilis]NBG95437.1 pimeloyl-CoA dehydrogenase large subunit [Pyruvatibacter mobilis]QJD75474.1 pimeloyl-CoA dehydrogenase large subunit [Pyruvatibacter mobilis]GGD15928.1 acyl-CoA dehydrogenase [Pyruvatibacter mobilis]
MDLSFSKEDLAFRDEVRAFIEENFTDDLRRKMARTKNGYLDKEDHITWQKRLHAKGWAAPHWPTEYGGPGFTHSQHFIYDREMSAAGVPLTVPFGITMVAPVIMKFGSEEQKKKYLPDILASNVWWCQGYSEPGAGSDLASLQMKAEDKGDHYLCNGSKIWTTQAQHADMIFCLVRTAKMEKRQDGISFLLIDMKTPGIKVEPLVTLDGPAEGKQEINQVFFEDVKVPKENLIGEENKGWTYAKYLLEFERGNSYSPGLMRSLGKVRKIAADTIVDGEPLAAQPEFQAKINDVETQVRAMEYTELRIFSALSNGQNVGPESSMLKCRGTELQQAISELALEGIGYYSMPFVRDTFALSNEEVVGPDYAPPVAPYYFSLRKASIYAGSNEIQRNIMSKAVLGL